MSTQNNDTPTEYLEYSPPVNISIGKKFYGKGTSHIVESCFFTALVFFIIFSIPFVPLLKVMLIFFLCALTLLFFLHGIKGRSVCQAVKALIIFRFRPKKYSYKPLTKKEIPLHSKIKEIEKTKNTNSFFQTFKIALKEKNYEIIKALITTKLRSCFTQFKKRFNK